MVEPILVVKSIKKDFSEGLTTLSVLEDVNLKLYPNEMVVVMGASGSGKTTLLSIIAGLEPPTLGEVHINNVNIITATDDVVSKIRRDQIGMVFQDFNLFPHLTAEENVEIPLIFTDIPLERRKSLVSKAIQQVGMVDKVNHYPNELSGGEKQRIAIARAIVNSPSILLVDEPTGNLDSNTGRDIISLFRRIVNQGKNRAILMTTHDPEAAKIADQILLLQHGTIAKMKAEA
ncbi:MAG: ABC transporter ATP-binding protein [Candidatus Hodarchaeota archaeon]